MYIRAYGASGFPNTDQARAIFNGNSFLNNTFTGDLDSALVDFSSDILGVPLNVGNNIVKGNNFGTDASSPVFLPPGAFSDGGGNICFASTLVITCSGAQLSIARVVNGASFEDGIESGSWVSILGNFLSATTRAWRTPDFVGNKLPVALDGVRVSINGKPAAISYVSPSQINAQAPDNGTSLGPVVVQVENPFGYARGSASLQQYAPAFFSLAGRYVAAIHTNGDYVAPQGMFGPGVVSRPARAGEIVEIFGTGFGPTSPAVVAGEIYSGAAAITELGQLKVRVGEAPATVQFAGIVAPGEYQFNVIVPELPDGEYPVVATIGGISTQSGLSIAVHKAQTILTGRVEWHGTPVSNAGVQLQASRNQPTALASAITDRDGRFTLTAPEMPSGIYYLVIAGPSSEYWTFGHDISVVGGITQETGNQTLAKKLQLIAPVDNAVTSSRPTLQWASAPGATLYRAYVHNKSSLVFEQETPLLEATVVPQLPPGAYTWQVWAYDSGRLVAYYSSFGFVVPN